ncbi:MAG: N-acetylneuraminate synthase family protein, partial [Pseudomonadota bacterium]
VSQFCLTESQFLELKQVADEQNIMIFSSAISEDWVPFLAQHTELIKIASGDLTFRPVIESVAKTSKQAILSTGCGNDQEISQAIKWFKDATTNNDISNQLYLMHCVSAYPTPMEEANILSIPYLRETFGLQVGYSNHVIGIDAPLAAVALGARVIECHFTDQKHGREFRDHALSLEWQDLIEFRKRAENIIRSMGFFGKKVMDCEKDNRNIIRKGLMAAKDIKAGQIISTNDIAFARPATGFSSDQFNAIVGKKISTDIKKGYPFTPSHFG